MRKPDTTAESVFKLEYIEKHVIDPLADTEHTNTVSRFVPAVLNYLEEHK